MRQVACLQSAISRFFFLFEISLRQLRVCYLVAPPLTRGRVCNLIYNCFWALPEQPLLGRSPAELTAIFYCLIWDSQPGGSGSRIYIPQEQGGAVVPPCTGFHFYRLLRFAGQRWMYSNPPPHGVVYLLMWQGPTRTTKSSHHDNNADQFNIQLQISYVYGATSCEASVPFEAILGIMPSLVNICYNARQKEDNTHTLPYILHVQ
jgi:hypothetical protein